MANKSLYLITDNEGCSDSDNPSTTLSVYSINSDGSLTPTQTVTFPWTSTAVGLTIDAANSALFMTLENTGTFQVINTNTWTYLANPVTVPGASSLGGIVLDVINTVMYDNKPYNPLYVVDQNNFSLYCLYWDGTEVITQPGYGLTVPEPIKATTGSATPRGIALDPGSNYLYVANGASITVDKFGNQNFNIWVYDLKTSPKTNNNWWALVHNDSSCPNGVVSLTTSTTTTFNDVNSCQSTFDGGSTILAVDYNNYQLRFFRNPILYSGDGWPGYGTMLIQHPLYLGSEPATPKILQCVIGNPPGGIFGAYGLAVDHATGNVYVSVGYWDNNCQGCYLVVFDHDLNLIQQPIQVSIEDNVLINAKALAIASNEQPVYHPRYVVFRLPPWLQKILQWLFK